MDADKSLRAGFSLIEIMVALTLLAAVALTMAAATGTMASSTSRDGQILRGLDLVREQIELIKGDPTYRQMESRYTGTEVIPGGEGFTRTTTIRRVVAPGAGTRVLDYKVVEVRVTGPGLLQPVIRTVTIGAP